VSASESELERAVGSVIVPEVRAARTRPGAFTNPDDVRPTRDYLRRFPPAGVVLFGRGPAGPVEVDALLAGVRADLEQLGHARPFAACDLEQGAGQHLPGATRLPPAMALAAADDAGLAGAVLGAGALTALEARARAVELVLAPVADVNLAADNPIIGVRSFGRDPAQVARHARAFHRGLRLGGALGCAKHFPGHGSAREDSHLGLPRAVDPQLARRELEPFAALCADGVASVMLAHLDRPDLTGVEGLATTLSPRVAGDLLRGELGFTGAALSDALDMGALEHVADAPARALAAGCDGLLCPRDPLATAEALLAALHRGVLAPERLREAAARMQALRARALSAPDPTALRAAVESGLLARACLGDAAARATWAAEICARALRLSRGGWAWRPGAPCEVLAPLHQARSQEARAAVNLLREGLAARGRPRGAVLPVVIEVGAGLGGGALEAERLAEIDAKLADLRGLGWPSGLVWFGPPQSLPDAWRARREAPVLLAWAATPPLALAARAFLAGRADCGGFLDGVGG
jgi:beta-glucosidase-like glycosyl hydrolase